MKKQIISTAIILTAVASVFAHETEVRKGTVKPTGVLTRATSTMMMLPPAITTGDAATDASIKALQTEMEAKIKAIRDEYQAKIKAVIGDKKVITGNEMMNRGSSTMRMRNASSSRMEDREEGRGTSTMMHRDDRMMNGSGTPEGGRPPRAEREGNQIPEGRQVKGESTEGTGEKNDTPAQSGFRGFFSKFFGR